MYTIKSYHVDEGQIFRRNGFVLQEIHVLIFQLPSSVGQARAAQRRILIHLDMTLVTKIRPKLKMAEEGKFSNF